MATIDQDEAWKAQYAFATQVVFTFYDWRHKILVRYAVVVAALGVTIRYLHDENFSIVVREVPFAVGVFFSVFFLMTDRIHTAIIKDAYKVGKELDTLAGLGAASLFAALDTRAEAKPFKPGYLRSYRRMLLILFVVGAAAFIAGGIWQYYHR